MNYLLSIERDDDGKYMVYVLVHGIAIPVSDQKWQTQAGAVYEAQQALNWIH